MFVKASASIPILKNGGKRMGRKNLINAQKALDDAENGSNQAKQLLLILKRSEIQVGWVTWDSFSLGWG